MENKNKIIDGLTRAEQIQTLVFALSQAKQSDFISAPEAKVILSDVLKALHLKETKKVEIKKEEVK